MRGAAVRAWAMVLSCVAACALLVWAPSPARATHVGCGTIVTQDTTLDSDIIDCRGNGVLIDGDGVTLDLAGHLIDGAGGAFGVLTLPGSSDVTVTGGHVSQFHNNVSLGGGGPFTMTDLQLSGGHDGILLVAATSALIDRVLAWGNDGSGINMPGSRNVLVTDSVMVGNGSGISAVNVASSRIERSVFDRSTFHGLRLAGLRDTAIVRNGVRGNGTLGLRLEDESSGNLVSRNLVSDSGADGIVLSEDSGLNRLERNRAVGNGGDGFDLAGPGASLIHNRADRNAGLGFDAPPGVALDAQNHARHNGDPRQCIGVDCDRRR